MINVVYHRKYHRLEVQGHAQSGEPGHDLVCAACSILAHTIASNMLSWRDAGHIRDHGISIGHGFAQLTCVPATRYEPQIRLVLDALCSGFELLAADYPEYIRYERRG